MALSAPVVPIMVFSDLCKGVINPWEGVFARVVAFGVFPGGLSLYFAGGAGPHWIG